ncbi:hypothetical protein F7725_020021 [Dissostichus mawsoni]|uniref:Uncharacterized protein n=1 Tax=Dissostichus mawsoni TaxID=36200 RepID=A0A7J5YLD4_DISMA|nr:hypothetical protein F7725_020021 [Dissostichus mawsoni]
MQTVSQLILLHALQEVQCDLQKGLTDIPLLLFILSIQLILILTLFWSSFKVYEIIHRHVALEGQTAGFRRDRSQLMAPETKTAQTHLRNYAIRVQVQVQVQVQVRATGLYTQIFEC